MWYSSCQGRMLQAVEAGARAVKVRHCWKPSNFAQTKHPKTVNGSADDLFCGTLPFHGHICWNCVKLQRAFFVWAPMNQMRLNDRSSLVCSTAGQLSRWKKPLRMKKVMQTANLCMLHSTATSYSRAKLPVIALVVRKASWSNTSCIVFFCRWLSFRWHCCTICSSWNASRGVTKFMLMCAASGHQGPK